MIYVISGTAAEFRHWWFLTSRMNGEAIRLEAWGGWRGRHLGPDDSIELVGTWWRMPGLRDLCRDFADHAAGCDARQVSRVLEPMIKEWGPR